MDLDNRGLYSLDLSNIDSLNLEITSKLFLNLSIVSNKLDELFRLCKGNYINTGIKYSWMVEKVNYCLKICSDGEICNQLKELYEEYRLVRDKIVEANLKLVIDIAYHYQTMNVVSYNDIIQYGNIGLMKAVEKYDINIGTKFSTYAYSWIVGSIGHNMRDIMYPTYVPLHVIRDYKKICLAQNNLIQLYSRDVTIKELSEDTGLEVDYIATVMKIFYDAISIDDIITLEELGMDVVISDLIEDTSSDVSKNIIDNDTRLEFLEFLKKQVTDGQYFILMKYFGFEDRCYTIVEIADMMGVTFQTISDLKNRAIAKLRKKSKIKDIFNK